MTGQPKKKSHHVNSTAKNDEEPPLIAVVIVDVFDQRFQPITQEMPKCLMPLANRPLLCHTLSALQGCGVQECIVYVSQHIQLVRSYLSTSGWEDSDTMKITVVTNEDCFSYGDALRDLDARALIRQDFILITGADLVTNVDFHSHLIDHKKHCREDKNAVMTLVMRQAFPANPFQSLDEAMMIAVRNDSKMLSYSRAGLNKKASFQLELFKECEEVTLRNDLVDVGVFICSAAVPPLFTDNFDNQSFDDFVRNIIENDLVESTLYVSEVRKGFMAKTSSPMLFMEANKQVLRRCCFPMVPEVPRSNLEKEYTTMRHSVYVAKDLKLARSALLKSDVIVGSFCRIEDGVTLSFSSISNHCIIQKGVTMSKSIVMENAIIEERCHIEEAFIGNNAVIGSGVRINSRCIIGNGVHVKPNSVLESGTRLLARGESESTNNFGPKAFLYTDEDDDDESDEDDRDNDLNDVVVGLEKCFWGQHLSVFKDDTESISSEEDDDDADGQDLLENEQEESQLTVPDIMMNEDAKLTVFESEVLESVQRGAKDGISDENLVLEINSSRHAYNVTSTQVVASVTSAVLSVGLSNCSENCDPQQRLKAVIKCLKQFQGVLEKYCKSETTQTACLFSLEEFCVKNNEQFLPIATRTIHHLYESDIVSEEAVFKWHEDDKDEEMVSRSKLLRTKAQALVQWLKESDEEDEDE